MGWIPSLFGGGRAPLQPRSPAPFSQPSDRDRRALFWWLRRNTCVTAIEHNAKLWADFMAQYEQWLRSKEDPYPRFIEAMKFGLDTQLRYEKGLVALKRGDKSVFNFASESGHLRRLFTSSLGDRIDWFDAPVEFNANRDECPVALVSQFLEAHQVAMAVGLSHSYFSLNRSNPSAAVSLVQALPFDTTLPAPRWDVSFSSGSRVPKDGIYEQVDATGYIVGGMAYFVKSQQTEAAKELEFGPSRWDATHESSSAFCWRLLWEDARYKDGTIPAEERYFQTPSESVAIERAMQSAMPHEHSSLRSEAGQQCPREGFWSTPAHPGSRRLFGVGESMPAVDGHYGTTIWQWDDDQTP